MSGEERKICARNAFSHTPELSECRVVLEPLSNRRSGFAGNEVVVKTLQ